jgi:hypothetical protein
VSVTVTDSSSMPREFAVHRFTLSPAHFLHLVKHPSSRRRSAAPFAGKRRKRKVTTNSRGSCVAGLGSFTPQPSRNGKLRIRTEVRVAAASAALAAAECLRHGQWNSLDKG